MDSRLSRTDAGQATEIAAAFAADESRQARLARDLRERVMEPLAALRMDVSWMRTHLDDRWSLDGKLDEAVGLLAGAVTSIRHVAAGLAPLALDDFGLAAALEALLDQFGRERGVTCQVQLDDGLTLEPPRRIIVYRIVQDWLEEFPAEAASLEVTLAADAADLILKLEAGSGSPVPDQRASGRRKVPAALRARVLLLQGSLSAHERASGGTSLMVRVPLHDALAWRPPPARHRTG